MTILVLGATGNTGTAIVKQLKNLQADFSIMVTESGKAAHLELQESQIRYGNYNNLSSLVSAFESVSKIYLLMPIHANVIKWTTHVITAAKEAGVSHVVKQSGLKASVNATSEAIRDHASTDELIKASGLDYTLIQPNAFFQNFYGNLPTINSEGNFYSSLGETALSLVDINDVAAVAVAALTQQGHEGKTHLVTGSEALTSYQHAQLLSKASGKEINYIDVPEEVLVGALKGAGLGNWLSEKLGEMIGWFTKGDYSQVTTTVEDVLGKEPRTFADFSLELAYFIESSTSGAEASK